MSYQARSRHSVHGRKEAEDDSVVPISPHYYVGLISHNSRIEFCNSL